MQTTKRYRKNKMDQNEPTRISSLGEFIEWVKQLGSKKHLFRGVPNAEYRIQASAYRRPKKEDREEEKFLQINKHLIADARLRGHGERDGRELGDLEILAQLQHFGAATCLIDFTHNAQVALYFACQKDLKWEKKSQDSRKPPDGKVYAMCNDPLKLKKVTPDLLKEKINYFLPRFDPYRRNWQLYYWEPGYQNNRIIAQQSIFVFGAPELDENDAYIITGSCKKDILIELEQVSGINDTMLFPDFDGFARLHHEDIPYTEPSSLDYLTRASEASREDQYEEAILNYDKMIELDPQNSAIYRWRAEAKTQLGWNDAAINDYSRMIELNPCMDTYETRGKALFRLKRYQQAIADFGKMIEIDPDVPFGYIERGEALYELGKYKEAIADFSKAIDIDPEGLYLYSRLGETLYKLGQYKEAIANYFKVININSSHLNVDYKQTLVRLYFNRALARWNTKEVKLALTDLKLALQLAEENNDDEFITKINQTILEIESEIEEEL